MLYGWRLVEQNQNTIDAVEVWTNHFTAMKLKRLDLVTQSTEVLA